MEWQWYWNNTRTTADTIFTDIAACSTDAANPSNGLCKIDNASSPSYTPTSTRACRCHDALVPGGKGHVQRRPRHADHRRQSRRCWRQRPVGDGGRGAGEPSGEHRSRVPRPGPQHRRRPVGHGDPLGEGERGQEGAASGPPSRRTTTTTTS